MKLHDDGKGGGGKPWNEELEAKKWAAHEAECRSAALAYLKEQKRKRPMR